MPTTTLHILAPLLTGRSHRGLVPRHACRSEPLRPCEDLESVPHSHLCSLPSHNLQVGWQNQAKYAWLELTGRPIGFKPATFYLGVIDHLALAVEGLEDPPVEPIDQKPQPPRPKEEGAGHLTTPTTESPVGGDW